jgi:hypothetical protein
MKTINKLVYSFFLLAVLFVNAQPPQPPGGGTGGSGTGSMASPVDMYVYALGIVAVMFIVFFTKKYASKKA